MPLESKRPQRLPRMAEREAAAGDPASPAVRLVRDTVEFQVVVNQPIRPRRATPSQKRPHAREQLIEAERLGQIVVRAGVQPSKMSSRSLRAARRSTGIDDSRERRLSGYVLGRGTSVMKPPSQRVHAAFIDPNADFVNGVSSFRNTR